MPGMCEKKCGECGLCIGHQAQGVIDEKDAEIKDLRLQVSTIRQVVNDELDYLNKRMVAAPTKTAETLWSAQIGAVSAIWEKMHKTNSLCPTCEGEHPEFCSACMGSGKH